MKLILFVVAMFACAPARAATGSLVYEAAASSIPVNTVTLSSTTPTLISIASTTVKPGLGIPSISWYSVTLYNQTSSSAAYSFSANSGVAPVPALTCASGAPIGTGSQVSPYWVTEQFFGQYMWGISCKNNETVVLKTVHRGR